MIEILSKLKEIYYQNKEYIDMYFENIDQSAIEKSKEYFDKLNESERIDIFFKYIYQFDKRNTEIPLKQFSTKIILSIFKEYREFNSLLNSYLLDPEFEDFNSDDFKKCLFQNFKCINKESFFKIIKIKLSIDFLSNNLDFDFNKEEKEYILSLIGKIDIKNKNIDLELRKKIIQKIGFLESLFVIEFNQSSNYEDYLFFVENLSKISQQNFVEKIFYSFFKDYRKIYYLIERDPDYFRYDYFLKLCKNNPEIYYELKKYISDNFSTDPMICHIIEKVDILFNIENF